MRPDLSLTGVYTAQGLGGTFFQRTNVFTDIGSRSTVTQVLPGGFGDSLNQLFGFGYPVYGFGLRLRLPIKNRGAEASSASSPATGGACTRTAPAAPGRSPSLLRSRRVSRPAGMGARPDVASKSAAPPPPSSASAITATHT